MAAAPWKGEEAPSRKPLTSCPVSSCRALVSSSWDLASKGMSAWWFPVFGEVLCGSGSVYIHELGCYQLATVETVAGSWGRKWRCPEVLALGA